MFALSGVDKLFLSSLNQSDPLLEDDRKALFSDWLSSVADFLMADRGRAARLARHLGVSRQRISQWFTLNHRICPGWVVQPTLEFLETENLLRDVRHPASQKTQKSPALANISRLGRATDFYTPTAKNEPSHEGWLVANGTSTKTENPAVHPSNQICPFVFTPSTERLTLEMTRRPDGQSLQIQLQLSL